MPLVVHNIPAFTDNYIWLFHQQGNTDAFVVDPGDSTPVISALEQLGLQLHAIIVTHHHPDHVGGIDRLLQKFSVPVYGPKGVPQVTHVMKGGGTLSLGETNFEVLAVPGHTLDHLAYFSDSEPLVFCGDTLFAAGCGRLFEGTPEQMWISLSRLAALPNNTKIFCTHEYTEANIKFALAVEPDNDLLQQRAKKVALQRNQLQPTLPSILSEELSTNPFLRANQKSIKDAAERHCGHPTTSEAEVFSVIRRWKDAF